MPLVVLQYIISVYQLFNVTQLTWLVRRVPVKHPFGERALKFSTGLMLFKLHGEKWLLFFLSPEVARANMMKFPSSPPGVHISGSC